MKRLNMKRVAKTSFFVATLCMSMMMGTSVQATQQNGNENAVSVIEVDSEKAIHLNGQSVVIRKSENNDAYINIYLDENRNGSVDEMERPVTLALDERGETSDINATVPIYGLYRGFTSNVPLVITVESGSLYSLYGVYGGTLNNTLKMNIKGGTFANKLYGVSTGTVSAGEGQIAVDIDSTSNEFCKYFGGVENATKIIGDVDIDWVAAEIAPSNVVMANFVGVENADVEGDVNIYISKLRVEAIYGLQVNSSVSGSYTYKSEFDTAVTHYHYGMCDSTVYGDADITVHGAQNNEATIPYVRGVSGFASDSDNYAVKGTTKVVYTDGYSNILYIIRTENSGQRVFFAEDVTVEVQSGNVLNAELINNANIQGSLDFDIKDGCAIAGYYKVFNSGTITGDVTMKLHNEVVEESLSMKDFFALCDSSVTGNAVIELDGGCYDRIRAILGSAQQKTVVSGTLDLSVKNVTSDEFILMDYGVVIKGANLLVEGVNIKKMYGLSNSVAEGDLSIDLKTSKICNGGGSYSYVLSTSQFPKGAKVDIMDLSVSDGSSFVPCDGGVTGNGSVYLNVENSNFDCAYYIPSYLVEGQKLYCSVLVKAKVGEESTAENPLADLTGLAKVLVGSENAMCSELSESADGLMLKDGKLYGTPTKAYPNGKDVTVSMTDGSKEANLTIRFVVAKQDCEFDSKWSYDDKYHWHACTQACGDESCDEVKDKAEHTWDDGVVTKEATATEKGEKTYTCKDCKATKADEIPLVVEDENNSQTGENEENSKEDENEVTPPVSKGTVLKDSDKKGDYTVTNADPASPEVSYKVTSKSAKEIVIPKTVTVDGVKYKVTSIKSGSFKNHKNLKKVTIGSNVKTIGKNAFSGCKKLTTVKMGKNVTSIGANAFYNCTALKSVTIPKDVKEIGMKAFYNCKKLTSINIKSQKLTTKNVKKQAFTKAGSSNYKKLKVKVPKKKKKAYKTMLKKRGLSSKAKVK